MITPILRVIGVLLLSGACTACQSLGDQGRHDVALERLQPCHLDDGPPDAYCGTLTVFEDRAAARGRTIALKIVVAPALRRNPRPDPLFVFEGGPGGGAATLARIRIPMFRRFQVDRDVVLVDQRGTGASNPLDCSRDVVEEDVRSLDDYPLDRYRRCASALDADPRLYTTAIAMEDIEEVRRHLGYERINLWGGSYGTRAALVFLQRHEPAVRTVILDGVAPPDMRLPLYAARDSQRALDQLIADCAREAVCARTFPGLAASIAQVWTAVAARPAVAFPHPRTGRVETVTVTPRLVASIVFQALYSPELSALLPRVLTDAAEGRYQGLLALGFTRDLPKGAMSDGMFLSVVCAEDLPRIAADEISREAAGRFFGTTMFDTQVKPCDFWPRGEVPDGYYTAVASNLPVLILSGNHDPITPPVWGEAVARTLPNARHFVVPGAGHGTIGSGCVPELMEQFLAAESAAGLDPACLDRLTRPPFFTEYTGPGQP